MIIKEKTKAQAEFFGLVIIVFLLSIGLIFVITLKSEKKTESIKSNYLDQVLSQNFINSLLNMRTECKEGIVPGLKLSQLITDCAEKRGASRGSIICDDNTDSCEYVNKTISILLEDTFDEWHKAYYFNISKTDIVFHTRNCTQDSRYDREPPGKQPFPVRGGTGIIFMMICKI